MKFMYVVMSKPPYRRLPRKAKKRIRNTIGVSISNKYSGAKVAIKLFDTYREKIRESAINASVAWSKFAPEPYPYGVPGLGEVGTLTRFEDYTDSVLKTT